MTARRRVGLAVGATLGLLAAGSCDRGEPGKAKVDAICSECHEKDEWADQDAAALEAKIKDVVAGKVKHKKKLTLTDQEAADIAAYWTAK